MVDNLSGLSREALPRISAIAKLALIALETPRGCNDSEMIAQGLLTIEYLACDLLGQVESEAGSVGTSVLGQSCGQRLLARYKARQAALDLRPSAGGALTTEGGRHG